MDHAYVSELASRLSIPGCIGLCVGLFPSTCFSHKVLQTDIGKEIQTVYTDTVNQLHVFLQLGTLGCVTTAFVYKISTECVFPLREHDIRSAMRIGIPLGVLAGTLLSLEKGRQKYKDDRQLGSNQPSDRIIGNDENTARGTDGNILVNIGKSPSSIVDNNEDIAGGAEGARRGDDLINGIGTSQNTIENNPDTSDDRERGQDTPDDDKNVLDEHEVLFPEDKSNVDTLGADHDSDTLDICLLHGTTDTDKAREYSNYLKDTIGPNLKIMIKNDFEIPGQSKFRASDRFFKEARYLFVYLPEEILKDNFANFLQETALLDCIEKEEYRNRIIPIRTTGKKEDIFRLYDSIFYSEEECTKTSTIVKLIKKGREFMK